MKKKTMKARVLSAIITLIMIMSMVMPAMAAVEAQTGKLTINGTVEGKKYDLYKIFDLTQSGDNYSYTVNEKFTGFFTGDKSSAVEYVGALTEANIGDFAKDVLAYAITNKIEPAVSVTGAAGKTEITDLPYGYYMMNPLGAGSATAGNPSVFALGTLSENPGDMEITVKTEYPTLDKKVDDADVNEASIGDTVNFKITTKIPDMTGYTKYFMVINDTMSKGLDFNADSVTISIGGTSLAADQYNVYKNGSEADGTAIQIVFKNAIQHAGNAGAAVEITYTAKLTENATIGTANENSASLEYSNDPKADMSGSGQPVDPEEPEDPDLPSTEDPVGETPVSTTETYTTQLTINKVDGKGNALAGAGFTLTGEGVKVVVVTSEEFTEATDGTYYKLPDGTYTETAPEGYTGVMYKKETKTVVKGEGKTETDVTAMVGADGKLTFAGLGAGRYTITESTVPNGYNKIEDITFTVGFDSGTKSFTVADNAGVTVENNQLEITITNLSGSLLPETGGIGTTIFMIAGLALMLGAIIVLITKRKVSSK